MIFKINFAHTWKENLHEGWVSGSILLIILIQTGENSLKMSFGTFMRAWICLPNIQ